MFDFYKTLVTKNTELYDMNKNNDKKSVTHDCVIHLGIKLNYTIAY